MITRAQIKARSEGVPNFQTQTADDQELFQESRMKEVQALLNEGCFVIVEVSAARGQRTYFSRFLDHIKADDTKRSRRCVAACTDNDHGLFTVALTSMRL